MLFSFFQYLFRWAIPPKSTDSEEDHYTWRIGVTLMLMALAFSFALHFTMVEGLTPWNAGHATYDEVNDLTRKVEQYRAQDLVGNILRLQKERCEATGRLRDILEEQITSLMLEFRRINKADFPLPTCEN